MSPRRKRTTMYVIFSRPWVSDGLNYYIGTDGTETANRVRVAKFSSFEAARRFAGPAPVS